MARVGDILRSPFSFLFARPQSEELVAEHIIREHHAGRALNDILADSYVTNRCSSEQIGRVLERPDVLEAIGDDARHL
jgi:hypothetical protein